MSPFTFLGRARSTTATGFGMTGRPGVKGGILRSAEGSQLLEFALTAPLLLVLIIGIMDFGRAYNLKQELNNAAREGARYAANQQFLLTSSTTVAADATVVSNYLTNVGVTQCAIGTTASGGPMDFTFSSKTKGCGSFVLEVNRNVQFVANGPTLSATKVTITYPFTWTVGNMMKLMLPGSNLNSALPATISTNATVQNIN